jgi:hypothetical protein
VQKPLPRGWWLEVLDVLLLGVAIGVSVWIVIKRRKRNWLVGLAIASLAYFGFYREGCICPIGSIQNVVVALADPNYSIPIVAIAMFFIPLVVALFFGRAFCGGVNHCACPGAWIKYWGFSSIFIWLWPFSLPSSRRSRAIFSYAGLTPSWVSSVSQALPTCWQLAPRF